MLINKAIKMAATAHKHQTRKGTDIPYITHPYAVGLMLTQEGYSEEIVAAGILHDTVEDTEITLEQLETEFGKIVADIVRGCSEPDKSFSWEERKQHTMDLLRTAPNEIRYVSCADKLHNIRSMREDYQQLGENLWSKFKRGREQQEWYYLGVIDSLSQGTPFPLLSKLRQEVDALF